MKSTALLRRILGFSHVFLGLLFLLSTRNQTSCPVEPHRIVPSTFLELEVLSLDLQVCRVQSAVHYLVLLEHDRLLKSAASGSELQLHTIDPSIEC